MSAEEYLNNQEGYDNFKKLYPKTHEAIKQVMVEYAKIKCKEQVEAIIEKVELTDFAYEFLQENANKAINKQTIIDAYNINEIK